MEKKIHYVYTNSSHRLQSKEKKTMGDLTLRKLWEAEKEVLNVD